MRREIEVDTTLTARAGRAGVSVTIEVPADFDSEHVFAAAAAILIRLRAGAPSFPRFMEDFSTLLRNVLGAEVDVHLIPVDPPVGEN